MTYRLSSCLKDFIVLHLRPKRAELSRPQFAIDRLVEFFGADRDVETIARKDIRKYRDKRLAAGVVDATIRRELSVLKSALEFACEEDRIRAVPVFKLPEDGQPRERWLTEAEAKALMDLEMPETVRLVLYIAFGTGARRGAILDLRVGRVDFRNRYIDFRDPSRPVTKKRRVKTKMSDWLVPIMEKACAGKKPEDLVVETTPQYVSANVKRLLKKIGVEERGVGIHCIRRTFTTWAFLGGATPAAVSAATGDNISTLEKSYLKLFPEHSAGATNTIKPLTGG